VHRWNTDQPQFNSANPPPGSPIILSGFPYRLSSVAVPEPGTVVLAGLGLPLLVLAARLFRRRAS
ncbi:MAG TPA: PEP-CTERM sorting domain-containing protein, partial [Armatimonadaceae bacterium]|nr:PEP-CTERM sorting domain-containing protein [Armatimonadaceae bacterium]